MVPSMSERVDVGSVEDFPAGTAKRVVVGDQVVAIVHTTEGLFAIEDRCSHADVALSEGEIDGCTIECWLHGSAFDLTSGEPLSLPAITPVRVYQLVVINADGAYRVMIDPNPVAHSDPAPVHIHS
jgi:3-phenylpropionate/trans-cinnamate dioxygenase ferredoxin subunit